MTFGEERGESMSLSVSDRLELNSYLMRLAQGWDEQAAIALVQKAHTLPEIKDLNISRKLKRRKDAGFTGFTPEAGDVTVRRDDVEIKVAQEHDEGFERVGNYLLRHRTNPDYGVLMFQHFQNHPSSLGSLQPGPLHALEYRRTDLEPTAYSIGEHELVRTRPFWLDPVLPGSPVAWCPRLKTVHGTSRFYEIVFSTHSRWLDWLRNGDRSGGMAILLIGISWSVESAFGSMGMSVCLILACWLLIQFIHSGQIPRPTPFPRFRKIFTPVLAFGSLAIGFFTGHPIEGSTAVMILLGSEILLLALVDDLMKKRKQQK